MSISPCKSVGSASAVIKGRGGRTFAYAAVYSRQLRGVSSKSDEMLSFLRGEEVVLDVGDLRL